MYGYISCTSVGPGSGPTWTSGPSFSWPSGVHVLTGQLTMQPESLLLALVQPQVACDFGQTSSFPGLEAHQFFQAFSIWWRYAMAAGIACSGPAATASRSLFSRRARFQWPSCAAPFPGSTRQPWVLNSLCPGRGLGWQKGRSNKMGIETLELAMPRLKFTLDINVEKSGMQLSCVCNLGNRSELEMHMLKYVNLQCVQMAIKGPGSDKFIKRRPCRLRNYEKFRTDYQ